MDQLTVRRSLTELQDEYDAGTKQPLEDLMRAWKGIKELPPDDPRSFFSLGGLHGEPFRGAGWGSVSYWGGYCNHGNVLFPTWHRAYLVALERALQSVPGCADVTLPYWDECSAQSQQSGIPWALTREKFTLDGVEIPNPLRSFVFTQAVQDFLPSDPNVNPVDYSKPEGYETVRYPLSGLVGKDDAEATTKHNAQFPNYADNVETLNLNVIAWLTSQIVVNGRTIPTHVKRRYERSLQAPNYTVFSNTTSMAQWNVGRASTDTVMALEQPHNDIHLAVGGFDNPANDDNDISAIPGANGDMGENDTAAFDPIFYFHHCFVDRVFWLWQQRHGATTELEIIPGYPGTNSVDAQGPTPGVPPNSWLTLDSPLNPFLRDDGQPYTSRDVIDIEGQLGYTYGPGSLAQAPTPSAFASAPDGSDKVVRVSGINRGAIRGSFVIATFATIDGQRVPIGVRSVLSRWNVQGCANCQTHLEAKAFVRLDHLPAEVVDDARFDVELRTRDGIVRNDRPGDRPAPGPHAFTFHVS